MVFNPFKMAVQYKFSQFEQANGPRLQKGRKIPGIKLSQFPFLILRPIFRNWAMLFDETLIELFDTDIGFKRIFCLTV